MAVAIDCKTCVHEKVCDLWVQQERQDASCFCLDGCDYFEPTLTQPNEPLTLEELREMNGEPVFLETGEVSIREQLIAEWEILTEHDDSCFYFTRRKRGFHIKDYGKTWIAYRRPPEGEEET